MCCCWDTRVIGTQYCLRTAVSWLLARKKSVLTRSWEMAVPYTMAVSGWRLYSRTGYVGWSTSWGVLPKITSPAEAVQSCINEMLGCLGYDALPVMENQHLVGIFLRTPIENNFGNSSCSRRADADRLGYRKLWMQNLRGKQGFRQATALRKKSNQEERVRNVLLVSSMQHTAQRM